MSNLKIRNVLSICDGMACGRLAIERANIDIQSYYASEINKYPIQVAKNNFHDIVHVGDLLNINGSDYDDVDLVIGGTPCNSFSFAGKELNFHDPRGKLFFEFSRVLNEVKQKNPNVKFLFENVKMKKQYQDVISKYLGVEPIEINSNLVSAQNRKRLYWTNIQGITQPEDKEIYLKDIVEEGFIPLKEKSQCILSTIWKENVKSMISRGKKGLYVVSGNGLEYRKLTVTECERLQTLPDGYTVGVSDTQRYKMVGEGWTVDVIAHILKHLSNG